MGVELRLRLSRKDAKILMQAWADGKLAHLNIIDIKRLEPDSVDVDHKKWMDTEDLRRDAPENRDAPPRK